MELMELIDLMELMELIDLMGPEVRKKWANTMQN